MADSGNMLQAEVPDQHAGGGHAVSARTPKRAPFVGRTEDLQLLQECARRSTAGQGCLVTVSGAAGTGKTRLIEEFRDGLGDSVVWRHGRATAQTRNVPYSIFTDLLSQAWDIDARDDAGSIRRKVREGLSRVVPDEPDAVAYVNRLFSVESAEDGATIDPECWKERIGEVAHVLLRSHAAPAVVCLEDVHLADPSSLELLRSLLGGECVPVVVVCAFRPPFSLGDAVSADWACHAIELGDLSMEEARAMAAGLLGAGSEPAAVAELLSGAETLTPLYVEEVINSLVESGSLRLHDGVWQAADSPYPPVAMSVDEVLGSRINRLESGAKSVLHAAAVIGSTFPHDVLRQVSKEPERVDGILEDLEGLDLVRRDAASAGGRFTFKHELTRQAAYDDMPAPVRAGLHERVAATLESVCARQLAECAESLAFHYAHGLSSHKAVEYLAVSAEKCLSKYALDETQQYYRQAFELASSMADPDDRARLQATVLTGWGLTFTFRGEFSELRRTLQPHRAVFVQVGDPVLLAGYEVALSAAAWGCADAQAARTHARRAIEIVEGTGVEPVLAVAENALAWALLETGEFDEAVRVGWRSHERAKEFPGDPIPQWASLHAVGLAHWYDGDVVAAEEVGAYLRDFSLERDHARGALVSGFPLSHARHGAGDFAGAQERLEGLLTLRVDPVHRWGARLWAAIAALEEGKTSEAEPILEELYSGLADHCDFVARLAQPYLGYCRAVQGRYGEALDLITDPVRFFEASGSVCRHAISTCLLGKTYALIARAEPVRGRPGDVEEGAPDVPDPARADAQAVEHLSAAIEEARAIGASGIACPAMLELAGLHLARGRLEEAGRVAAAALDDAVSRDADGYAHRARELLEAIRR